jgi:hypothetical protein
MHRRKELSRPRRSVHLNLSVPVVSGHPWPSMAAKAIAAVLVFLTISSPVLAHHSSRAAYDMTKKVTMAGVVTKFQFQNPHIYIMYDVKDEKNNVVHWSVETYAPVVLVRRDNWGQDTLKPGDPITVTVWPSKGGAPRGFLVKLVMANGLTIY